MMGGSIVDCFLQACHHYRWGLSGERCVKKIIGDSPSDGVNSDLGVGDPSVAMKMLATNSSSRVKTIQRFPGASASAGAFFSRQKSS
jgi:hypothetical protein